MAIERLDIVTTSPARHDSFARLLPNADIRQLAPQFTEELIPRPLNTQPAEWPMEMSERKALQDITTLFVLGITNELAGHNMVKDMKTPGEGKHLRIYSDTISVSYAGETTDEMPVILEKPRDLVSWFQDKEAGALALSGKNIEICTGITAIDMKNPDAHPATVLVRITAKMRPYTMEDIKKIIDTHGPQAILTTAGGISIWNGGTSFYDGDVPLKIYLQTDPFQQPVLVNEVHDWQKLDKDYIKQLMYGAVPEAMDTIVHKLDSLAAQKKIIESIPITVRQARSTLSQNLRDKL